MERQWPYHLSIMVAAFCYAWIGIFVKFIDNAIPPMSIAFFRLIIALLFLSPIIFIIDRQTFFHLRKNYKDYLWLGFLLSISMASFTTAVAYASVSVVTLLWTSYVFWTAIFAYFVLNEHLTLRCLISIILGICGVLFINPMNGGNFLGNLLALLSSVSYACYLVYLRKEEKTHSIGVVFWILIAAAIFLTPFFFIFGAGELTGMPLLWMLCLGVFCTGIAYLSLNIGLKKLEADVASVLILIFDTLFSVLLAVLLLHEPLTTRLLIGGSIILCAGLIMEIGHNRKYVHDRKIFASHR